MLLVDSIDNNATFNVAMKSGGGGDLFVKAYATSGMVANTPYAIQFMGSGYNATALAASIYAYVGIADAGKALASGCVGWVQIRGKVADVQGPAASFTGSVGHAVYWAGATGLGATSSAYVGNQDIGQVGMLLEELSSSTTGTIFLTGIFATPI